MDSNKKNEPFLVREDDEKGWGWCFGVEVGVEWCKSAIILSLAAMEEVYTQRVYIDPQRLMQLKKERKPLKLVPSIYQPPPEPQEDTQTVSHTKSLSLKSRSKPLIQPAVSNDLITQSRNANIQFIVGLLGEVRGEQVSELQEGDCVNIRLDQRWLLLEGEVRVCGHNGYGYTMQEGYFFFVSVESKRKVKEVVCLRRSKVLRVPSPTYDSFLKNYIFLKNAEKIKYLKYCPFFLWSDPLSEDLASCMSFATYQREQLIYTPHQPADTIFFVKEGVVLLERAQPASSPVVGEYQAHYEKEGSGQEATIVVKKGMVFGIDGILIKEYSQSDSSQNAKRRSNGRIYTAKTIGRTELYCIRRDVLETLFSEADLQATHNFPREMTKADLQRICADYADLVVRHRSLPKIVQAPIRKELILQKRQPSAGSAEKRLNAQRIRFHQEAGRQMAIANIIADPKTRREHPQEQHNASLLNQLNYKLSLGEQQQGQPLSFPSLTSNVRKRRQRPQQESMEKYIFKWLKDADPQLRNEDAPRKKSQERKEKRGEMLINVRSYRSIIPLLT